MTDRINALTVVLDSDMRADDAAAIVSAIKQLRGVLEVQPNVANCDAMVAEVRARHDIAQKLMAVLYPTREGK